MSETSGMQQNQGQKTSPSALPPNLTVRITTLTHIFQNYAKRSQTKQDKHYLFGIVESVGTAIVQETRGVSSLGGGFTIDEWMTECGVSPEWGQLAA